MTSKPDLLSGAAPRVLGGLAHGGFSPMLRGPQVFHAPDDGTAGPLTVDQAVASLLTPPTEENAPEAPTAAAEESTEPQGETSAPEEAQGEPVEAAEGEETGAEAEAVAPAEPPKYWSKDAKEAFAALPAELQAVVLEQEGPREAAAAKAKADATAKVAEATAEMGKVTQLAEHLSGFLPQALETFRSRWGDEPDWVAVAQEHGAEAMTLAKAQYDAEKSQIAQLVEARRNADNLAHTAYLKAEFAKLAEIAPDLAPDANDPKQGSEARQAVVKYVIASGIAEADVAHISAAEMLIAQKAMRWDEAQAKLKAAPKPKPAPLKPGAVRPAAAQAQSPSQRQATSAQNAFNAKPSIDNAVALLLNKA